jgi:hypothetical protein
MYSWFIIKDKDHLPLLKNQLKNKNQRVVNEGLKALFYFG